VAVNAAVHQRGGESARPSAPLQRRRPNAAAFPRGGMPRGGRDRPN